jgi:hypothetical protein
MIAGNRRRLQVKTALTCLLVVMALCLVLAPAALALEGADPCMVLLPSGGPSIRVQVNSLCDAGGETGNISWKLNGTHYNFNVTGNGQAWTEGDAAHCKLNLHGSDTTAGSVAMFTATIQVNGKHTNTASITWTDNSYNISLVYFKGNEEDQEYSGSGPIVNCDPAGAR